MKHRWNYSDGSQVQYGVVESYQAACSWLDESGGVLEDWGCGCAFAKRFVRNCKYVGIDGSENQYADKCGVDLATYRSDCDCILMRHVLDHNEQWKAILLNAVNSFRKRMALVFFIDFGNQTKVLSVSASPLYPGVPDIQFKKSDIIDLVLPYLVKEQRIVTSYPPFVDSLLFLEKQT